MVPAGGIEPPASSVSWKRSSRLSYADIKLKSGYFSDDGRKKRDKLVAKIVKTDVRVFHKPVVDILSLNGGVA